MWSARCELRATRTHTHGRKNWATDFARSSNQRRSLCLRCDEDDTVHPFTRTHHCIACPYLWSTNVTSIGFLSVRGVAGPQSRNEQRRSKVCHGTMHGRLTIPSPTRTLASKNRLSYHARGHLSPPQSGQSVDWTSFDGHVWEGEDEGSSASRVMVTKRVARCGEI